MAVEKNIGLNELKIGMVISQDIVNRITGTLVIKQGTVLDEKSLKRLRNYYIESDALSKVSEKLQGQKTPKDQAGEIKKQVNDEILSAALSKVSESLPGQLTLNYLKEEARRQEDKGILNGSIPSIPVNERQIFINFKNSYADTEDNVKQYLSAIDNGQIIVVDEVAAMTNGIMGNLSTKSSIFTYLDHLKQRNDYTYSHSINVSLLCHILGKWLNLNDTDIVDLTCAGMIHNIGESKVAREILNKKGKLTETEFNTMQRHTTVGYETIADQPLHEDIKLAVLQHHERIDGSGYPHGLKDNEINRFAKIVAICDVYLAMVSERPYRLRINAFEVIKEFERRYLGRLDTEYLMVFLKNIAYFYLNRKVKLSNDKTGEIIFINNTCYSSPIVMMDDGVAVDLLFDKSLYITSIL